MLISRLHGHMSVIRSTKSVPGAHLIGGDSRSASQSLSTRTKFDLQQYLLWWHRGLTFCWLRRFHNCRCQRLLPPDLSYPARYLSAPRAPHWAHLPPSHRLIIPLSPPPPSECRALPPRRRLATADGDAASHQAMFAGLRLARTGELRTKAFGKRLGLVSAQARRFIIDEPYTGPVRHSSSSRTRRTFWLCR